MFKCIEWHIAEKRKAKILESAFPTGDGESFQKWIHDYFYVDYVRKSNGGVQTGYFVIRPYLYGNPRLKHGNLIKKYAIDSNLLSDYSREFRVARTFLWYEYKNFSSDIYYTMKKTFNIIRIWDDLLDSTANRLFLDNGIQIQTASYYTSDDQSTLENLTPKKAERVLEILRECYKTPQTVEYIDKYEEYLIQKFAQRRDNDILSAERPVIDADTFSNRVKKIEHAIQVEEDTAKLKIIPKIAKAYYEIQGKTDKENTPQLKR